MLTLDAESRATLTDQLYEALRGEIAKANLEPGMRMPSKRQLARELHVSTATIEAAYARLASEGYCESRPRSGMYVAEQLPGVSPAPRAEQTPVRWDFSTGAADAAQFPYATWAKLMREVLSERRTELLLSGDPQGSYALREEIAAMLRRMRGVEVAPETIVVGAGTDVLVTALLSLIGRDRLFAVEDPGYSRVRRLLAASGARISPTPLLDGAVDLRALYMSGAGAAYVTPSHQFPTGQEMTAAQREGLLRWAAETGGEILEDDCDSEFRFSGVSLPPLRAMDGGKSVVYMNTFARTLAPGLRLSFMALPEALAARYRAMHAACSVPGFEQEALRKFIAGGYLERHVSRMRVVYRSRMLSLCAAAKEMGLGETESAQAGLHILLRVGGSVPERALVPLAAKAGVRLTRLSDYGVIGGAADGRTVLLGFAGMDEEQAREGLAALKRAWKL